MAEVLLVDGGMGTALIAAGLPAGALPERWVLERPAAVAAVHAAHASAGARLLLTCTFNLASPRLAEQGLAGRADAIAGAAVALARAACPAAAGTRVAGAVGPTGLVRPGRASPPDPAELRAWYEPAFRALAAAGADLLWAESQWDLGEALAALDAGRATGLPVAVTLAPASGGTGPLALHDGTPLPAALRALAAGGAAAAGVNCLLPGTDLSGLAAQAADLGVPLVVKPSAGLPGALLPPGAFAAWAWGAVRAGARWVGGCCGAGPEHLAALAQLARG